MASVFKKTDNAAEIDRLALALAKEPGSKVFIPLAEEYGKAGMWEEAVAVLEDGLKSYPHFVTAMVALGRVYEHVNQPAKAKAILEEAVKLSPENLRAHRILARLYAAEGMKDATVRSCNVILAVNPHDQEALSLRSVVTRSVPEAVSPIVESSVVDSHVEPGSHDHARGTVLSPDREPNRRARIDVPVAVPAPHAHPVSSDSPPMASPTPSHASSVATLEQWLGRIQLRRRDLAQATR